MVNCFRQETGGGVRQHGQAHCRMNIADRCADALANVPGTQSAIDCLPPGGRLG